MTLRSNQIAGLAAAIAEIRPLTAPADALLHHHFRRHAEIGRADRAFITEGVFAYLRRRRSIEALAETTQPSKLALATLVRALGHSVRELEPLLRAVDARWLREFKARPDDVLDAATLAELPDWLWQRMGKVYGDDVRAELARALLAPATLDLRINPLRTTREDVRAALATEGIVAVPTPWSPLGLRIQGRPSLSKHRLLLDGNIEIQDEGSQLIGLLVAPKRNDMVVDFCAGAGGKTLLLGALMRSQGRLYAFDTVDKRLARMKPRLARSGLSNVHPQLIEHERDTRVKRLAGKIDRVLVDVPCTGFGTLRRNPDLKWRQPETAVAELAAKQRAILAAASTLLKPGGRLVYATCSILPEENQAIVDDFLACHPDFRPVDAAASLVHAGCPLATGPTLQLLPQLHGCDGFFAAVLERAATAALPGNDCAIE